MISFDAGPCRFHLRVAIVLTRGGDVLLHRAAGDRFWTLPGGRVEAGETAADAALREMREELGEAIECGRLLFVVENFFTQGDVPHHEVGLYFEARAEPGSRLSGHDAPFAGIEAGRSLVFDWFDRSRLHAVDVRPAPLVDLLQRESPTVVHRVHRDAADAPAASGSDPRRRRSPPSRRGPVP